jgi:hypothetical protein
MRFLTTLNERSAPNAGHILGASSGDANEAASLPSLFDDYTVAEVVKDELSALRDAVSVVRRLGVRWLRIYSDPATTASPRVPTSWQEVHRGDTDGLIRRRLEAGFVNQHRVTPSLSLPSPSSEELNWARRHSALIFLLRTGQWQPVPSAPPEAWTERLATEFSGITAGEARKILVAALDAAPVLHTTPLPQPLSPDERGWVCTNGTVINDLCSGHLRGIPKKPSRPWITALQSAVGGTGTEISALLNIVLGVIDRAPTAINAVG